VQLNRYQLDRPLLVSVMYLKRKVLFQTAIHASLQKYTDISGSIYIRSSKVATKINCTFSDSTDYKLTQRKANKTDPSGLRLKSPPRTLFLLACKIGLHIFQGRGCGGTSPQQLVAGTRWEVVLVVAQHREEGNQHGSCHCSGWASPRPI